MLTNNANPNPGAPVANHFVENLLAENHPNAFNMNEIPYPFATCFLVREV